MNVVTKWLSELFWLERVSNGNNYPEDRQRMLYNFFNAIAKIWFYGYFVLTVVAIVLGFASKIPWPIVLGFVILYPIVYRVLVGFQLIMNGVKHEEKTGISAKK